MCLRGRSLWRVQGVVGGVMTSQGSPTVAHHVHHPLEEEHEATREASRSLSSSSSDDTALLSSVSLN
jgi:hypothetical protein